MHAQVMDAMTQPPDAPPTPGILAGGAACTVTWDLGDGTIATGFRNAPPPRKVFARVIPPGKDREAPGDDGGMAGQAGGTEPGRAHMP
jgi:hypothetical protein